MGLTRVFGIAVLGAALMAGSALSLSGILKPAGSPAPDRNYASYTNMRPDGRAKAILPNCSMDPEAINIENSSASVPQNYSVTCTPK